MSQQILNPGIDPTAFSSISGAQFTQMFTGATLANEIGGIIYTLDDGGGVPMVPNANSDATLKTFIWIRVGNPGVSGNFAIAYVWNPNSANPVNPSQLLNWNPITSASIGPGTIQGYQIAANTIPASALQGGITASQVIGLQSLMLNAITAASTPSGGAITGSFGSGFALALQSVVAGNIANGAINSYLMLSGQVVLPLNIDTTASAPATNSVIMAANGTGQPAAWVLKQILKMNEPIAPSQIGYIPAVQADGSVAWNSPTNVFPAGAISAAAEVTSVTVTVTSGIAGISVVSGTTWQINTANTGSLVANQTIVTFAGFTNKFVNLNGSWLVTQVTNNASFQVVTVSGYNGSTASTLGTVKYCNYIGSSNVNVANTTVLVGAGAGAITTYGTTLTVPSVVYNSTGNYTIFFVTPRGSGTFIVTAQALDSGGTNEMLMVKVKAKNTAYVTVEVNAFSSAGGFTMVPTDNVDLSVIVL